MLFLLLLLDWVRATPDCPFKSSKNLSQTRLIGLFHWHTICAGPDSCGVGPAILSGCVICPVALASSSLY